MNGPIGAPMTSTSTDSWDDADWSVDDVGDRDEGSSSQDGPRVEIIGWDGAVPVVTFPRLLCPHCKSDSIRVTKTLRPKRYHFCRSCHQKFHSLEG